MEFGCKTRTATVFYLDKQGKFPHSVEIKCAEHKCQEEGRKCKQVFWIDKKAFEIHHFCSCVHPDETEVNHGAPSGQMAPCQITIVQKQSSEGVIMEPKCIGHCREDFEDCFLEPGEMEMYARPLPDGRVEVGYKKEFYCRCKRKG